MRSHDKTYQNIYKINVLWLKLWKESQTTAFYGCSPSKAVVWQPKALISSYNFSQRTIIIVGLGTTAMHWTTYLSLHAVNFSI